MRILIVFILFLTGCNLGKYPEDPANPRLDSTNFLVEIALNTISSTIDEQTGETVIAQKSPSFIDLLIKTAYAGNGCGRAYTQTCSDSKRSLIYTNCTLSNKRFEGVVELTYSNSSCSILSENESVTRSFGSYIYGVSNGVLINTSNNYSDYRRYVYGGGSRLTRQVGGNYRLDILGKHSQVLINNYLAGDISIRSLNPVIISQGLSRTNRKLDGGTIEVSHNGGLFTATMSVLGLEYQSGCCYPTKGTVNLHYTGSRSGNATVIFNSCGKGTLSEDGSSSPFQMNYCE